MTGSAWPERQLQRPRQLWSRLTEAGVEDERSETARKRLRVTNQFAMVLGVITLPYTFVLAQLGLPLPGLGCLALGLAYLSVPWLNARGHQRTASGLIMVLFNCGVFLYAGTLGPQVDVRQLYYVALCLPLLLSVSSPGGAFLALVGPLALWMALELGAGELLPRLSLTPQAVLVMRWAVVGTVFAFLSAAMGFVIRESARSENRLSAIAERLRTESQDNERAGETLAQSEAHLRAVLDSALDAIITIDDQGRMLSVNAAGLRMFGYDQQELLEHNVAKLVGGADHGRHDEYIERHSRRDARPLQPRRRQGLARRKDGSEFPIELSISGFEQAGQRVFTGVVRDLTEAKRTERELEQNRPRLHDMARQAGIAEVASSVLHNVGNVLNSLKVSTSVAEDRVRELPARGLERTAQFLHHSSTQGLPGERVAKLSAFVGGTAAALLSAQEQALEELARVRSHIGHIERIVDAQQASARIQEAAEAVSLEVAIEEALVLAFGGMEHAGPRLVREITHTGVRVHAERHKLLQILVNLLRNAADAVSEVEEPEQALVHVRVHARGPRARIEVRDTGVGIDPQNLQRIFTHGFTTKPDGHGFGLHASALHARQLGGTLEVQSEGQGRGASFTLSLPMCAADSAA